MKTRIYLYDDTFITADDDGVLHIESGALLIFFDKEQAKKITKFLNYVYGKDAKNE